MKVNMMEVAKVAALVAAGYAVVRVASKAKASIAAGADAAKAVVEAVADVVATDLNPASDQNLAYRGVNNIGAQVTNDPSFNLGNRLWEFLNRDKVAKEKALLQGSKLPSDSADVQRQIAAQESFRATEIRAENEAAAEVAAQEARMAQSRSSFRVSELIEQKDPDATDFGSFTRNLSSVWVRKN